jgi:outer membrane lipoprotein carrier protein
MMRRMIKRLVIMSRGPSLSLLAAICCWALAATSPAGAQSAVVDRMIESLASTQTLSADFSQTTAAKSARLRSASGTFYISKPGLLRWEVKKPYPQIQLLNDKEFWLFDVDLAQASVRPVHAANLTGIAALLLNTNSLTREQLLSRYGFSDLGARDGLQWIGVTPKTAEPGITSLAVGVDSESLLRRFEIHDNLGQVTRIELTRILKNVAIDPKLFQFTPPAGVSVLRAP